MPYLGKSPSAGVRQRYQYTATAGQTTFSGTDTANLTLTYTDNNFVDVFQNGVLLKGGTTDYTATSGTSVVLATGASVSDVIEIIVYDVFSVGNFYNRTDSDSRYLNVAGDTMTGSLDLNGTELVLDVDGDSSITVDTDDQIDFRAGGTDVMAMSTTGLTITNASNDTQLTLKSTDADANVGPVLDLYRNSASPADNDRIGSVTFRGRNDNSQDVDYTVFDVFATDVSDGTEDVEFDIRTIKGGTETSSVTFLGTETVFNQASTDLDFRVESNGNANMLFVNAGDDRIGIGTASPAEILHLDTGGSTTTIQIDSDTESSITFNDHGGSAKQYKIGTNITDNNGQFEIRDVTSGASRMRIDNSGTLLVGTTSGTISQSAFGFRVDADGFVTFARSAAATSAVTQIFGASGVAQVLGDGDLENTNGRFTAVSDERLKENIVDASSQWDDIKAIKVRNYNFKEEKGWGTHKQIGVVAQELEASGMTGGLVKTKEDGYKSVATSVLYMKAVKALQEAMARIETLETKNDALEARIKKLEDG